MSIRALALACFCGLPLTAQQPIAPARDDALASAAAAGLERADAAPRRARDSQGADERAEASTYAALQSVTDFAALLERDARISFGPRTHGAALREFEKLAPSEAAQAAALMALGAARVGAERARMESIAREAALPLRQAAILALGELRSVNIELLLELSSKRAAVAEFALFALVRNATAPALAAVQAIADQTAHPLHGAARDALGFALSPPVDSPVARTFLDLRFEAARRCGLIDDQAWTTLLVDDLARNQRLLSRVVYRAAAESTRAGIKDHFLEIALAGGAPERLRGVVRAMPTELSRLIDEELFKPADEREWTTLVDEIAQRGLGALCQPILRRAWFEAATRARAMELLAQQQAPGSAELVELALRGVDAPARAAAVRALAHWPAETALPLLESARRDEVAQVRAAALVSQFRLGSESAAAQLREQLEIDKTARWLAAQAEREQQRREGAARPGRGAARAREPGVEPGAARGAKNDAAPGGPGAQPAPEQRLTPLPKEGVELVEALLAACADRRVRDLLAVARARAAGALRLSIDTELAANGDARSRAALRESLREQRPAGEQGARAIAALARGYALSDLELVRELFPLGDDLEVDAELVLALIAARDGSIVAILRAALWSEPWNRSVLAGALLLAQGGVEALRGELARPPAGVTERDLRRVGFALGEWGGAVEVDRLAGRVGAADPALQGALLGALSARTR